MAPIKDPTTDAHQAVSGTRVLLASWIGTVIEWYDFFAYGTATALVFNRLFFPNHATSVATLIAFGTYAAGFAARPIGGVVCGHFGDRLGRKSMLVLTLLLMGASTTLIGCLPTYESIGTWAPLLLVMLRLVQGFAIGGEYGGASLLAVEFAPSQRRGVFGSIPQSGAPAGLLLAAGAFALVSRLPEPAFLSWGWRIPFLASAILVMFGFAVRAKLVDSPIFEDVKRHNEEVRAPGLVAVREHWRSMLLLAGCRIPEATWFYLMASFVITFATIRLGLPKSLILNATIVGSLVEVLTLPIMGLASDRIGRRPMYIIGAVVMGFLSIALFPALQTRSPVWIYSSIIAAFALGHGMMYGPQSAFFAEMFPTRLRYSGTSIAMQSATVVGGGLSPLLAVALVEWSGGASWPITLLCLMLAALAVCCAVFSRETYRAALAA